MRRISAGRRRSSARASRRAARMEVLDHSRGDSQIDFGVNNCVRNRVEEALDLHAMIATDPRARHSAHSQSQSGKDTNVARSIFSNSSRRLTPAAASAGRSSP